MEMDSYAYNKMKTCKVKLENNGKGFLDITTKCSNLDSAIENALQELYYNYTGKSFISIEINRVILFLDRFEQPYSSCWNILGRKYKSCSDVFLTKTIPLGRVETKEVWDRYDTFYCQMKPLLKAWISLIQKGDVEMKSDYEW